MPIKNTVLILGAGSSKEFNLPTGTELAQNISSRLFLAHDDMGDRRIGDDYIDRAIRINVEDHQERGRYSTSALSLSLAMNQFRSVDEAIWTHGADPRVVKLGKMAIVESILFAEKKSTVAQLEDRSRARAISSALGETWIGKLFQFMTGVRREEAHTVFDNLTIINFNYDRCVEHILYNLVQLAFSLPPIEAASVMRRLNISHPYGRVGSLPHENIKNPIRFGEDINRIDLWSVADDIKTYTEQNHDDSERKAWRQSIANAEQVIFIGFGFHRQNMALLSGGRRDNLSRNAQIYATTLGTSSFDQSVFRSHISRLIDYGPIHTMSQNCEFANLSGADFLTAYGLLLVGDH